MSRVGSPHKPEWCKGVPKATGKCLNTPLLCAIDSKQHDSPCDMFTKILAL